MSSYSVLKCGYTNKTHTHAQSGAGNFLFRFCQTIKKPFSPICLGEMKNFLRLAVSRDVSQLIMRVDKPTFAYKFIIFPPPSLPPYLLDIFSIHKYIDLISTLH